MQALQWLASPALPALTAQFQPEAVLWMAQPAYGPGNATWAVHHLIANFSGGPPPQPTGRGPPPLPARLEFVKTTMWCAESVAAGEPLIAEAVDNARSKLPLVSIGPGPEMAAVEEEVPRGAADGEEAERGGRTVPAWVIALPTAACIGVALPAAGYCVDPSCLLHVCCVRLCSAGVYFCSWVSMMEGRFFGPHHTRFIRGESGAMIHKYRINVQGLWWWRCCSLCEGSAC